MDDNAQNTNTWMTMHKRQARSHLSEGHNVYSELVNCFQEICFKYLC